MKSKPRSISAWHKVNTRSTQGQHKVNTRSTSTNSYFTGPYTIRSTSTNSYFTGPYTISSNLAKTPKEESVNVERLTLTLTPILNLTMVFRSQ